jgi:hypothetical protein
LVTRLLKPRSHIQESAIHLVCHHLVGAREAKCSHCIHESRALGVDGAKTKLQKRKSNSISGKGKLQQRSHKKKWQKISPRKVFARFLELPLPSS